MFLDDLFDLGSDIAGDFFGDDILGDVFGAAKATFSDRDKDERSSSSSKPQVTNPYNPVRMSEDLSAANKGKAQPLASANPMEYYREIFDRMKAFTALSQAAGGK